MNDASGQPSSSSLAITEKRPQKPGGCVGLFFQFFDWNRRLAKKKLFSKKLLPPARAKRVSKKLSGDDKLPMAKLLLIADENRGGFPTSKKSEVDSCDTERRNHGMRSPGLIARLMGLESMPAVRRDKPKKAPPFSEFHHDEEKKSQNNLSNITSEIFDCDGEDLNLDKGHKKVESRPQKLQKTGMFDRRQVTRFGADALQFRSVISRSKKRHQKLVPPVKSPRRLSGRSTARLVEAATKFLEPGLQATNRAKCALTYSPFHVPPKDEIMVEGGSVISLDQSNQFGYYVSASKSLKEQSCKNCGNLLDLMNFGPNVEEQAPPFAFVASELGNAPPQGSGRSKPIPTTYSLEQERDEVVLQNQDLSGSPAAQAKVNMGTQRENIMDRKPPFREDQVRHHVSSQRCKSQKDAPSSTVLKQRTQRKNPMLVAKDRTPPRPKLCNMQSRRYMSAGDAVNGPKDFVALNRNLSSHTRLRMPPKVPDNSKVDMGRNACDKLDDPSSRLRATARKRRPMNGSCQVESTNFGHSTFENQRNIRGNVINGKRIGLDACSVNQNHVKSGHSSNAEGNTPSGNKDIGIVSFMFNSPMRHSNGFSSPKEMEEKRRGRDELMGSSTFQQKKLLLDAINGDRSSQKPMPLGGDALGALLEQKLKELTYQDRDELAAPGRSTATILHELISALTAGRAISQEDGDSFLVGYHENNSLCYMNPEPSGQMSGHSQMFNSNNMFQAEPKAAGVSVHMPLSGDGDHPSPGSVLEASFSNDSCFSGSLNGGSGHKMHPESMDYFYDQPQPSCADGDLLDSANSFNTGRAGSGMVTNSINAIFIVLDSILAGFGLVGSKLNYAREVILNAEILFGNAALSDIDGLEDFLIVPVLLDKLEIVADALCRSNCSLGFMEAKDDHQLRRFVFDSMIEFLDLKYGHYCKSGFRTWMKMPLHMSREFLLIREVYEEISRWKGLDGKMPDEIIEIEISHSLGKWTDFEVEAFETGCVIEQDLFQLLIDEMFVELWQC